MARRKRTRKPKRDKREWRRLKAIRIKLREFVRGAKERARKPWRTLAVGSAIGTATVMLNNNYEVRIIPRLDAIERHSSFDVDADGDIDGIDFSKFAYCYNKTGRPFRGELADCLRFDVNRDGDVDGDDFAAFVGCANKAGRPYKAPHCNATGPGGFGVIFIRGRITTPFGLPIEGVEVFAIPDDPRDKIRGP